MRKKAPIQEIAFDSVSAIPRVILARGSSGWSGISINNLFLMICARTSIIVLMMQSIG